jgi:uracil-DNA glycosylase
MSVALPILDAGAELERRLDEHRAALDACRRCANGEVQGLPVIPAARRPKAMLVGQAPGKTEAVDRRPFAGPAGRTLFRWLADAGLDEPTARDALYMAAVTRCFPGQNASGRGDRVPSPRERLRCADWLDAELAIIRPKLLIPVGRLAVDRFIGPVSLDQVVGRPITVRHAGGESIAVVLPHPSGASSWIHEAGHRALLDEALRLLRRLLAESGVPAAGTRDAA